MSSYAILYLFKKTSKNFVLYLLCFFSQRPSSLIFEVSMLCSLDLINRFSVLTSIRIVLILKPCVPSCPDMLKGVQFFFVCNFCSRLTAFSTPTMFRPLVKSGISVFQLLLFLVKWRDVCEKIFMKTLTQISILSDKYNICNLLIGIRVG